MNQDMQSFFDRLAADWDSCPDEYETREKIVSLAEIPKGSVIADIGCGRGVMFEHLLKTEPKKLIAVDLSGEMIRHAKEKFSDPRIAFFNEDLLEMSLPEVDAAIIYNAYPHFLDKHALGGKLAEVIGQGGILIIAHGRSRALINGTHRGERVSTLSVPLDEVEKEAAKFEAFFRMETVLDNDQFYFLKLRRK